MSAVNNSTPPEDPIISRLDKILAAFKTVVTAIGGLSETVKAEFRKGSILAWIGILVGTLGFLATMFFGILAILPLMKNVEKVQSGVGRAASGVERVEKNILARQFTIIDPVDGALVDITYSIRGKSPFPNMNNYIVVTPLKVGTDFVQDGPLRVSPSGLWTGKATFGAGAVGEGESFLVRCLATDSTLTEGPLTTIPSDAIFSESITIIRKTNRKE